MLALHPKSSLLIHLNEASVSVQRGCQKKGLQHKSFGTKKKVWTKLNFCCKALSFGKVPHWFLSVCKYSSLVDFCLSEIWNFLCDAPIYLSNIRVGQFSVIDCCLQKRLNTFMLIQRWYVEGLKESCSYFGAEGYSADFFDLFFFFLQKNRF